MSVLVYVLTALAAVVVFTTWKLLGGQEAVVGNVQVGRRLVKAHLGLGAAALVTWLIFLTGDGWLSEGAASLFGIIALFLWWFTAIIGGLILLRWLPSRGKHSADVGDAKWWGPWLSALGHIGMFVGVVIFTWAYLTSAV